MPFTRQGNNACYGVTRLGKSYSHERLEAACSRALALGTASHSSVESILKKGLDHRPLPEPTPAKEPVWHENVRGADYLLPLPYHPCQRGRGQSPGERDMRTHPYLDKLQNLSLTGMCGDLEEQF